MRARVRAIEVGNKKSVQIVHSFWMTSRLVLFLHQHNKMDYAAGNDLAIE